MHPVELLRDIIGRYLDRTGLGRRLQYAELEAVWRKLLGEAADHTRLDAVRNDVAVFVVDNAALLAELNNFRKAELLDGLRAELKGLALRDLKFRPGTLRPGRPAPANEKDEG